MDNQKIIMPSETGVWDKDEAATGHDFSYQLARFIGAYFPKDIMLIDIGCGKAEYLRYLHDTGFQKLLGIEGSDVSFEYGNVKIQDLTTPLVLEVYGNVVCLEVGEHIPEQCLNIFLENVTAAINKDCKILISWAIPGQDGIGHVSCRHNIWVLNEFEKRGFKFLAEDSLKARSVIENRMSYFRNTIMIFQKL